MLPPCSTLKSLSPLTNPLFSPIWWETQDRKTSIVCKFVTRGKKMLICSLFICLRMRLLYIYFLGCRGAVANALKDVWRSQHVAGRQSVSAPTVRIWGDRYINMGPIKYRECNLWKWQIILFMLSGNYKRCIIEAVSETNMRGLLKSGCGQCG